MANGVTNEALIATRGPGERLQDHRYMRPAGTGTPLRGLSVKQSSVSVERPGYHFAVLGELALVSC